METGSAYLAISSKSSTGSNAKREGVAGTWVVVPFGLALKRRFGISFFRILSFLTTERNFEGPFGGISSEGFGMTGTLVQEQREGPR